MHDMFDYLTVVFMGKRRAGDVPAKINLDDVIADNIQATQDLAETITRYSQSVTRLGSKSERGDDCEYDHPQRRASDRR